MGGGKRFRLARLIHPKSRRTVLVALDHGVTGGPIAGLEVPWKVLRAIADGGAQGVIVHRGIAVSENEGLEPTLPWILHLSGSTGLALDPDHKVLVASVEEAVCLGADAVSIHVNLGVPREAEMLRDLGDVAGRCQQWGMPLLAMMYVRWARAQPSSSASTIKHAARVAAELGADLVKVAYPGGPDGLLDVVHGCFAPVLIAGGERDPSDRRILEMVESAVACGASGVCIGRNVFQHPSPQLFLRVLAKIVHEGMSVEAAIDLAGASPSLVHARV